MMSPATAPSIVIPPEVGAAYRAPLYHISIPPIGALRTTRIGFPPSWRRQNPFATRKSRGSSGGGSRRNTVGTAVTTTTTVPCYRSSQWRRSDEFSKQGDAVGFRGTREEGQHVGTEGGYVERGQLVEDGLMQVCRIRDANLGVKVRVVRCSLPQQPGDVVEVASHRTRPVKQRCKLLRQKHGGRRQQDWHEDIQAAEDAPLRCDVEVLGLRIDLNAQHAIAVSRQAPSLQHVCESQYGGHALVLLHHDVAGDILQRKAPGHVAGQRAEPGR